MTDAAWPSSARGVSRLVKSLNERNLRINLLTSLFIKGTWTIFLSKERPKGFYLKRGWSIFLARERMRAVDRLPKIIRMKVEMTSGPHGSYVLGYTCVIDKQHKPYRECKLERIG